MLTRLNYRTSESVLNSLKTLTVFDYSEKPYNARDSEIESDRGFLARLDLYMPILDLRTKIPNLALRAKSPDLPIDQLYNKETFIEFHLLLSELLGRFSGGLKALHNSRAEPDTDKVIKMLNSIALLGSLLQSMIKGAAIKKHLQVIENFLPDRPNGTKTEGHDKGNDKGNDKGDDEGDKDNKEGSKPEAEARPLPRWKRCSKSLELLVTHFDSAQVLIGFFKPFGPNLNIDIKVLSQPLPDRELFIWQDLLKEIGPPLTIDEIITFLKAVPDDSDVNKTEVPATETVLQDSKGKSKSIEETTETVSRGSEGESEFIEERKPTAEDVLMSVRALIKIPQVTENLEVFANAVDEAIFQLKMVTNCSSPLSRRYTPSIIKRLENLKGMWVYTNQHDTNKDLMRVIREVKTLRDNALLQEALEDGTPLSTGDVCYRGTHHCEAGITAYCCLHPEWGKFVSRLFPCRTRMFLM